ncbi:hypothetical protein F183_A29690 [Bryobacterales bacterium F-183]|nr:hypothetical protein F183_A29690 [Bryobacterales bacterium F-183]
MSEKNQQQLLSADCVDRRANQVAIETTYYDLSLIFGNLSQSNGAVSVVHHSMLTIPWTLVPVLAYKLATAMAAHQRTYGKITLHPAGLPPRPDEVLRALPDPPSEEVINEILGLFYHYFGTPEIAVPNGAKPN